ncbi:MAG: FkbM family methyltransferase [Pseudomonadota bacterium]
MKPTRNFTEFFDHVKTLGFEPKTVIDVGVATGTPALYRAFPEAYFILAEPILDFEPHLKEITTQYRGEYHLCALMSEPGTATVFRSGVAEGSLEGSSMMHRLPERDQRLQPTEVKTLDDVFAQKERESPVLLKTDCQGGDFEVVLGGTKTLRSCELVIMEVSLHKFWGAHHPDPLEIIAFMDEQDFVLYDFLDGIFRPLDNALGQIDMVFVRRDGTFRENSKWG